MPLNTPYVFVQGFIDNVENKIHIVHMSSSLPLKYMRDMQLKFTKTNPKIFSNGGGCGPGSAFVLT